MFEQSLRIFRWRKRPFRRSQQCDVWGDCSV